MLHTKFQGHWSIGSGEEDFFKAFYQIWTRQPCWLCDPTHLYKFSFSFSRKLLSGEPGLVDRVLALTQEIEGSNPTGGTCPNDFFRSNRPGYPHPVSSELESSGIRVAVGDCSVSERRRWRPPYQTGKTVHVHAKHYKHNEDGRTALGVCGSGTVPLSQSGNVVTRIGIHTYTHP